MSLFNVNQTVSGKVQNTSEVPIKDKQFLIVTDSGDIFYDFDGKRIHLTDTIVLDSESQRLALASPFEKFYFVKEAGVLWRYISGSWVKLSGGAGGGTGGSNAYNKTLAAAEWSNNQQSVVIDGLTAEQNGFVGLSQDVSAAEYEAAANATMWVSDQKAGSFTVSYHGDKPTCDIPITVIIFG